MKAVKAERPFVTAGAMIVGASIVAMSSVAPPTPDVRITNAELRLTAASASIANIPVNIIQAIVNIPANELAAMQSMADALLFTGSWWTGRPNQIWGTDPADPPKWRAGVAMLVPFPALSGPLGESLAVWAEANFPVNASCHYICHDVGPILAGLGQVPVWQLYTTGYTFPTVVNPLGAVEGAYGFPGTGPGNTMPWSGQTVKLDPFEPLTSVIDYLVSPPTGIKQVSLADIVTTVVNLGKALVVAFSPFTLGGPLTPGWPYSAAACPACAALDAASAASEETDTSLTATSASASTLNVSSMSLDGDVQRPVVKDRVKSWAKSTLAGSGMRSANGWKDLEPEVQIAREALSSTTEVSDVEAETVPDAGVGLQQSIMPVGKSGRETTRWLNRSGDADTDKPGKPGAEQGNTSVKPTATVKSFGDRISAAVSKATDKWKGSPRAEKGSPRAEKGSPRAEKGSPRAEKGSPASTGTGE